MPSYRSTYLLGKANVSGDIDGGMDSAEDTSQGRTTVRIGEDDKNGLDFTAFYRFDIDIPPGATIDSAVLEVTPQDGQTAAATARLALLARDGRWDDNATPKWFSDQAAAGFDVSIFDTGAVNKYFSSLASSFVGSHRIRAETGNRSFGFVLANAGADYTIGEMRLRIERTGTVRQQDQVWCEVWSSQVVDGLDVPLALLAASDRIQINTLSNTGWPVVTFAFTGADQINIATGVKHYFCIRHNVQSTTEVLASVRCGWFGTPIAEPTSWGIQDYDQSMNLGLTNEIYLMEGVSSDGLPYLKTAHNADGPNLARVYAGDAANILSFAMPNFVVDVPIRIGDAVYSPDVTIALGALIQKWVNDSEYRIEADGDAPIAFAWDVLSGSGPTVITLWSAYSQEYGAGGRVARLTIDYQLPGFVDASTSIDQAVRADGAIRQTVEVTS